MNEVERPAVSPPRPAVTGPVAERFTTELVAAFAVWLRGLRRTGPRSLARRGSHPR